MKKYSNILPPWKFILLSIGTFGLYELFWFYKVWHHFKLTDKLRIRPSLRALFAPFFIWSLAHRINQLLKKEHITFSSNPFWLGLVYIFFCITALLPDPFWIVSFLAFWPLLPLLKGLNLYWEKQEKGKLPLKPFEVWQSILIGLGVSISALVIPAVIAEVVLNLAWEAV